MKAEQKIVGLDAYEEGAVIEGLNKMRTEQLEKEGSAEFLSDLMLKILQTPARKVRTGVPAEYRRDFVGGGGATEQASFCRRSGETSKRSPRRRDEAR